MVVVQENKIMTDIDKKKEILKNFDKKFTIASFTWNGNNFTGNKCAKQTRLKVKRFLTSSISQSLDKNNKEWLKRVEGLKMNKMEGEYWKSYNSAVNKLNTSIDNLVNNFKEGKE